MPILGTVFCYNTDPFYSFQSLPVLAVADHLIHRLRAKVVYAGSFSIVQIVQLCIVANVAIPGKTQSTFSKAVLKFSSKYGLEVGSG